MRDINEDSNSSSWPLFYGDKTLTNGHYYNGFIPRTIADSNLGWDKDALKQKMLEHEAIFKNQVYELHRLYRRQRDMMEEVKRKEYHKHGISIDTSSSSSLLPSQKLPSFPLVNSCARPSIFGAEISNSPLSCSKGNTNSSKDCEIMDCRPSKVRKKLFDLELLPDENIDHEELEEIQYKQASEESSYKDTSSGQCFRESNGLADLNEPIDVEEAGCHGSVGGPRPSAKPNGSQFLGPTRVLFEKSQSGPPNGAFNPLLIGGKGNGRDWLCNNRETGNSRSNMNYAPDISTRIQDHSRFSQTPLRFNTSCASSSYPYMNPTDMGNSWGKPNGSLTHNLSSYQKQQSFISSPQSHMVFGDKWRMNECYTPNGFYPGSTSGSKDPCARLPSGGFDNRNCNNLDDRSQKIFKGPNFIDLTDTTKGIDLNNDINSSRKCDQTVLPWLQAKPAICKTESPCDDRGEKGDSLVNNGKILGFPVFGDSCVSKNDSSSLVSTSASLRCLQNRKAKTEMENRGFDINIAWDDPANKQIDLGDYNLEKKIDTEIDKIKNHFDLNSCLTEDEDVPVADSDKNSSEKVKKITMEIDLEAPAIPEVEEEDAIDEVKNIDDCDDESLVKVAAEAIVEMTGISRQQDQVRCLSEVAASSDDSDPLLWFVEVIDNAGFVSNELDEYEELTLQQELTKEEDYMPKPMAPEIREPDEVGPSAGPTRPRRGQARRGRPRRDFQRDILPGLVSLSRHEVTEDLQIFGGLMRATGHSWNVGLTRRNGTRGRRKSVAVALDPPPATTPPPPPLPPPPPVPPLAEVVGLEERSLTGWGKTTRRPRRQRCAAGTSVAVPLT